MNGPPGDAVLRAALACAKRGKPVFPCRPDKRPYTAHGFHDATTDEAAILAWWAQWPDALIGMPTGEASGLVVLDVDVKKGHDGEASLLALLAGHDPLPETIEVLTPSGGRHIYFAHPGLPVKCSTSALGDGLDVRGDGGYVILPPSGVAGRAYQWEASNPERPAPMPDWLVARVTRPERPAGDEAKPDRPDRYAIAEGKRNSWLTEQAGRLRRLGYGPDVLEATLGALNRHCRPPLPPAEVATIARSVARYPAPTDAAGTHASPVLVHMSEVAPERIQWLWPGRIAIGKVTLIAGDPGLGKSLLTVALAAHVTRGRPWPVGGAPCPQGSVLMLSAEDDPADTIRPRLDAAGADPESVSVLIAVKGTDKQNGTVTQRHPSLRRDLAAIEQALDSMPDCKLLSLDPISAYLDGADSHNNADIRGLLAPLSELAARRRIAIVCVTHLNKGSQQSNALYRATGSLAFVAAARAVYLVTRDKEDRSRRLVLPAKNNLAPDATGLAYSLVTAENGAATLAWESEPVTVTAEEALATDSDEARSERDEAVEFLRDLLRDGPMASKEVFANARQAGISEKTLRRAKDSIGVTVAKGAFSGGWRWSLPAEDGHHPPEDAQDGHPKTVAIFGEVGHLRGEEAQPAPDDEVLVL